ncbi:hypothetical protein PFISCL1PPCAC_24329, partial [Pristionchus fissidentatus]
YRDSIDVMESVSAKLYLIASDEYFNSIKRRFQSLQIKKVSEALGFLLQPENKNGQHLAFLTSSTSENQYVIIKWKWAGNYQDRRGVQHRRSILICNYMEMFQNFFANIQRSLKKNCFVNLHFRNLALSNIFIDELEKIFFRIEKSIEFYDVVVSQLCVDNKRRFTNWILSLNVRSVVFTHTKDEQNHIFDENFIKTLATNKRDTDLTLKEEFQPTYRETTRFAPSENINEFLYRFKTLKLFTMIVNSDWIMELV